MTRKFELLLIRRAIVFDSREAEMKLLSWGGDYLSAGITNPFARLLSHVPECHLKH